MHIKSWGNLLDWLMGWQFDICWAVLEVDKTCCSCSDGAAAAASSNEWHEVNSQGLLLINYHCHSFRGKLSMSTYFNIFQPHLSVCGTMRLPPILIKLHRRFSQLHSLFWLYFTQTDTIYSMPTKVWRCTVFFPTHSAYLRGPVLPLQMWQHTSTTGCRLTYARGDIPWHFRM